MRQQALAGYADLTVGECLEVVEYVIGASRQNDYPLDLRWMERGWQDFRLVRHGKALRSWRELIASSMKTIFHEAPPQGLSKQEEVQLERENIKRLMHRFPDDVRRQLEESGLKRSTFYQRRREVLRAVGGNN